MCMKMVYIYSQRMRDACWDPSTSGKWSLWTLKKQAIEGTRIRQLCIDVRTDWSIMYLNTAAGCFWLLSDSKDAPMYMMYAELLLWYCNYTGRCRCHLMSAQGFAAVGRSKEYMSVAFGARTLHSAKKSTAAWCSCVSDPGPSICGTFRGQHVPQSPGEIGSATSSNGLSPFPGQVKRSSVNQIINARISSCISFSRGSDLVLVNLLSAMFSQ